jgi:hypothetical protein
MIRVHHKEISSHESETREEAMADFERLMAKLNEAFPITQQFPARYGIGPHFYGGDIVFKPS